MEVIEPRVVYEKKPSESLVYHIDMAKKASHDLRYSRFRHATFRLVINDEVKAAINESF